MTRVRGRAAPWRVAFALALALLGGSTATASAALQADYAFDDTLASSVGTAPALTQAGNCPSPSSFATETVNGAADRVLTFPLGCGLQLASAGVIPRDSYSVAVLFRFTNVGPTFGDGYHRIFDPTPGLLDNGIYETNGKLNFFQNSTGSDNLGPTDFVPDQYTQVVVTRDAAGGTVVGYMDGVQQWSITDSGDDALITAAEMPRFLVDNFTEDSAGAVARLRLYDAPLTAAEVAALDGNAPLPPADISIATTADKNPVYLGQDLVYSISLSNAGPGQVGAGVVVTDDLPAGVDFVSASPGCAESAGTVTCDVGVVTADSPTVLEIVVHPTVANAALANTVTVGAANDPNPANNSSTATTKVRLPTDVSITMTESADPVYLGQTVIYRLTVANAGPGTADSAVATYPLPADVDFVSASSECVQGNGAVTCEFGPLASGATVTRQIEVRPTAPDPALANGATLVAGGDTNPDNNIASAVTAVLDPPPILGTGPLATTPVSLTPPATTAGPAPQPPAPAPSVRVKKPTLAVTARRAGKTVTLSLAVANLTSAKAIVSVTLKHGARTIARGAGTLKAGRRKLTLRAAKTIRKGTYRLAVAVTQSGKTTDLRATLKLK